MKNTLKLATLAAGVLLLFFKGITQPNQKMPNFENRFLEDIKKNRIEQVKNTAYIPLLDTAKRWTEAIRLEFGYITTSTTYTGSSTDTLFCNDTAYTILFNGGFVAMTLREDTIERKVFARNYYYTGWDPEWLLYDFGMHLGDSISGQTSGLQFYLDSVVSVLFNGIPRRVFYLHSNWDDFRWNPIWVEGIGSLAGILKTEKAPSLIEPGITELTCVHQNNEQIFQSHWAFIYGCNFELFDQEPPVLQAAWATPDTVADEQYIKVYVRITDNLTGFGNAYIQLISPTGEPYNYNEFVEIEEGLAELTIDRLQSPKRFWNAVGTWWVCNIAIWDGTLNEQVYSYYDQTQSPVKFYVSHILDIDETNVANVSAYPNPAHNKLILTLPETNIFQSSYTIYDTAGKKLQSSIIDNSNPEIQLDILNQGVYLLKITTGNQTIHFSKFIKL